MKLMQFLMGLDDSYMQLRSNILSRDPLPDAKGGAQRSQTFGNTSRPNTVSRPNNNGNRRIDGGPTLVFEHYGFNGHTIDKCYKLIGYPSDFGKKNNSSNTNQSHQNFNRRFMNSNNSVGSSSTSSFSDEQISKLISLIKENSLSDNGKGVQAIMAQALITKVARDSKLIVGFDESKCFLMSQDLMDVKIIEIGKQVNGLYYFDNIEGYLFKNGSVFSNNSKINRHKRLGHLSDQFLSVLQDDLVFEDKTKNMPCDICRKAKQTRESFPLSEHKSTVLAERVHLDLWGPYKVVRKVIGSNGSASENEMAATTEPETALSEGDDPDILTT
ncbi:ribonuclease H-like domain-containing protein [Tanacetum coccineum]